MNPDDIDEEYGPTAALLFDVDIPLAHAEYRVVLRFPIASHLTWLPRMKRLVEFSSSPEQTCCMLHPSP